MILFPSYLLHFPLLPSPFLNPLSPIFSFRESESDTPTTSSSQNSQSSATPPAVVKNLPLDDDTVLNEVKYCDDTVTESPDLTQVFYIAIHVSLFSYFVIIKFVQGICAFEIYMEIYCTI